MKLRGCTAWEAGRGMKLRGCTAWEAGRGMKIAAPFLPGSSNPGEYLL